MAEYPAAASALSVQPQAAQAEAFSGARSEEHTSELQSQSNLVCRLLLEKKKIHERRGLLPNRQATLRRAAPAYASQNSQRRAARLRDIPASTHRAISDYTQPVLQFLYTC